MQPKKCYYSGQFSLLSPRLDTIINMQHELVKLTQTIEWEGLEITLQILQWGIFNRALHLLLKHIYHLSDEVVCEQYIVNPYYQYLCGEEFFQHDLKMERSSMTH